MDLWNDLFSQLTGDDQEDVPVCDIVEKGETWRAGSKQVNGIDDPAQLKDRVTSISLALVDVRVEPDELEILHDSSGSRDHDRWSRLRSTATHCDDDGEAENRT